jgi:serine/threonine-protein kinase HipA
LRAPEFVYEASWLESPAFRPLSLSLPATSTSPVVRGEPVNAFFDNLLPDSEAIRRRVQQQFKTPSREAFDLLAAVGRDCVGAVQLLPLDEPPADITRIEARPLDDAAVERALIHATAASGCPRLAKDDDFRISIAGAQEKTALLWHEGRWCRPCRHSIFRSHAARSRYSGNRNAWWWNASTASCIHLAPFSYACPRRISARRRSLRRI